MWKIEQLEIFKNDKLISGFETQRNLMLGKAQTNLYKNTFSNKMRFFSSKSVFLAMFSSTSQCSNEHQ